MVLFFFTLCILLAAAASFFWSWKRLLDFNSYKKPFLEGTILNFIILLSGSLWWTFISGSSEERWTGIFYFLICFLVILVLNGAVLAFLYSKRKDTPS
ncbi:hypothetical protein [Rossellomorea vietnamensis]|uniref:hypothetical protein n=1 Tax=Rossellomorea vietnamensis TaxID=218284 RepID=UPI001653A9C8|nr:hypothetical protein [Rossellomorea vietnamensis]